MEYKEIFNLFSPIVLVILPLIGGLVGYFLKYWIDKKKELQSEVSKERRVMYQEFVELIFDILESTKKPKGNELKDPVGSMYRFYKKYALYGSPEVINSFSNFFQYMQTNKELEAEKTFKLLSKVIVNMRSDLGLSNKNLGQEGEKIFRAVITDFDRIMKK